MPEYLCLISGIVPTSRGGVKFSQTPSTNILFINGRYIINDRRGIFTITEVTLKNYFKLAPLPGSEEVKKERSKPTKGIESALRLDNSKNNERRRIKNASARALRQELRVAHGGYRKNRFNVPDKK